VRSFAAEVGLLEARRRRSSEARSVLDCWDQISQDAINGAIDHLLTMLIMYGDYGIG